MGSAVSSQDRRQIVALLGTQIAGTPFFRLLEDLSVNIRIDARQGQAADLGEQAAGERIAGSDLFQVRSDGLGRHAIARERDQKAG